MALFIPDISHHQAGISIQALKNEGAAALIARVGQAAGRKRDGKTYGTTRDREWLRHRDESRRIGLPLVAYWYIGNLVSADDNAKIAEDWVGDKSIPWMLDHEDASGSIAFYRDVLAAFRRRGLKVVLGYIPKWYYDAVGGGDLSMGPPLVNSRYSTRSGTAAQIYSAAGGDTGNGWINFGGQKTELWQFTNKASMAGRQIDCSAYRGSYGRLMELIGLATPIPAPAPVPQEEEEEMKTYFVKGTSQDTMPDPHNSVRYGDLVFLVEATADGLKRRHIHPEEWKAASDTGAKVTTVAHEWMDAIGNPGGLFPWENAGGGPVPGDPQ